MIDDVGLLETLLMVNPTRLEREERPISGVIPAGSCRVELHPDGVSRVLIPGFEVAYELAGHPMADPCRWPLRGPLGPVDLVLLPDSAECPVGQMGASQKRHFYNGSLATLMRRRLPPELRLEELSGSLDTRQRVSGRFGRLVLRRPGSYSAGLVLYPYQGAEEGAAFLAAALVWHHHCRHTKRRFDQSLVLLTHSDIHLHLAGRLALLDPRRLTVIVWRYDLDREELQSVDLGEIRQRQSLPTTFEFTAARPLHGNLWVRELLQRHPGLQHEKTPHRHDLVTFRGLPLVRLSGPTADEVFVGWASPYLDWRSFDPRRIDEWVAQVMRLRAEPPPQLRHPAYRLFPERWLEYLLLQDIRRLDPALQPAWTFRQVPAYRGTGRSIMDVLSLTTGNRLAVIEIKAAEDGAMLFQALDYWDRVREGLSSGALQRCGYFAGLTLDPRAPVLYLVAPMFRFHRHLEVLAGYLAPDIPIILVGLSLRWRSSCRVIRKSRLGGIVD